MSISDRCLMVFLTVTKPQMTKKDVEVSKEVADDKNASSESVAVIKKLYPKHLIQPIVDIESAARRYVDHMTGSTNIRGFNVLPSKLFMPFQEGIGVHKLQFDQAVTVFLMNFANVMMAAQSSQGDMFNRSEYPDLSDLKKQFTFTVQYIPMGKVDTVMLDLEKDSLADLKTTMAEQEQERFRVMMADAYARLHAAVKRIHTQCSKPDGKIYDTLTGNLKELLEILPAMNLTEDPKFDKLCVDAQRLLVSPVAIKTTPGVRESTAATADEILKAMEGFL